MPMLGLSLSAVQNDVGEDAQQRGAEDAAKHTADNASRVARACAVALRGYADSKRSGRALQEREQTSRAVAQRCRRSCSRWSG